MKPAPNSDDLKHLIGVEEARKMSNPGIDDWLQTQQGRYVMDWEMERIDTLVVDLDEKPDRDLYRK